MLSQEQVRLIADRADVDVRSAIRWLAGVPVRPRIARRLLAATQDLAATWPDHALILDALKARGLA